MNIAILFLALLQTDPKGWTNVTSNVGGETWGYAGVTLLASPPDRDEVIAGVSEQGLWSSGDGGKTWKKLGGAEIKHRPHQIVFDPKDSRTYWVSGCYGAGIFRTTDGGASFHRLGKLDHVDGVAIDFSDPARRTLLTGLHEQVRSLMMSTDGGETWTKIGDRLPEDSNFSTDPIILDSNTFLINTAGWAKGKTSGIYRSADAGKTWAKVSDLGVGGRSLVTPTAIVYPSVWNSGLIKGTEKGATWTKLNGPKTSPVALPGGRLAALADTQVWVSKDEGATWEKAGPPLPVKVSGIAYNAKGKALYAWRSSEKKIADAVFRWEVTE